MFYISFIEGLPRAFYITGCSTVLIWVPGLYTAYRRLALGRMIKLDNLTRVVSCWRRRSGLYENGAPSGLNTIAFVDDSPVKKA